MERKNDQNLWNFLFSLLFLGLLGGSFFLLSHNLETLPRSISFPDFLLLALATFRLTRLFVYDKITLWFRSLFLDSRESVLEGVSYIERTKPLRGPRRTISDLLACPWCISVWFALLLSTLYFLAPWSWYVILVLAISSIATLLQLFANLLGWSAEYKKLATEEKERMI